MLYNYAWISDTSLDLLNDVLREVSQGGWVVHTITYGTNKGKPGYLILLQKMAPPDYVLDQEREDESHHHPVQ